MRWVRARAAVVGTLLGCGSSPLVVDGQPCDDAGACPEGQTCEPDGVCRRESATTWIAFEAGPSLQVRLPGLGTVAAGDLHGDGSVDVAFGFGPRVALHLGAGEAPAYTEVMFAPDDAADVLIDDADGDDVGDLLVAVRREFGGAVLLYAGGDLEAAPLEVATSAAVLGIALARIDDDAAADLIVQTSSELIVVFAGSGGSPFDVDAELVATGLIDPGPFIGLAVVDAGAGTELVASGPVGQVNVVAYAGARRLAAATLRDALNPATSALFAADFDGDGRSDLGLIGGGRVRLFPSATSGLIDTDGQVFGPALPADLNGDGRTDLVTIGADGPDVWLAADSAALQLLSAVRLTGPRGDVAVADYDGDGKLDVIASDDRGIAVFLQRGP